MQLACGPYFRPEGFVLSIIVLLVLKPLAYYAFIQAFRFRVSRPIPMTTLQAAGLAALRTLLGAGFVGIGAVAFQFLGQGIWWEWSWVYLYVERIVVWTWLGSSKAGLRGRRLLGWTISGTLINAAFDLSIAVGLIVGFVPPIIVFTVIAVFIAILHTIGRRPSLLAWFSSDPHCMKCEYNLTGNLSGICPECGTPVAQTIAARTATG